MRIFLLCVPLIDIFLLLQVCSRNRRRSLVLIRNIIVKICIQTLDNICFLSIMQNVPFTPGLYGVLPKIPTLCSQFFPWA
jgi:hypothetical protein